MPTVDNMPRYPPHTVQNVIAHIWMFNFLVGSETNETVILGLLALEGINYLGISSLH